MFRRRASDASDVLDADQTAESGPDAGQGQSVRSGLTPKKAGPTPKRSEAEASRRGPYQAPSDRKSAVREGRVRDRGDRTRRAQALQRGEDWALPAKDRGPVRALARDVVDARRGVSEYYLFAVIPIVALLFLHNAKLQLFGDAFILLVFFTMIGEGIFIGRRVERIASERLPGQNLRGVKFYAFVRGAQFRKLRMPKPRVNRGDQV